MKKELNDFNFNQTNLIKRERQIIMETYENKNLTQNPAQATNVANAKDGAGSITNNAVGRNQRE